MIKGIAYQAPTWGLVEKSKKEVRKDLKKIKDFGFDAIKIWGPSVHLIENDDQTDLFFDEEAESKVWTNFKENYELVREYFSGEDIYAIFAPANYPFKKTKPEEFVKWFLKFYDIVKGCEVSISNEITVFSDRFKGKHKKIEKWLSFINKILKIAKDKTGEDLNYNMSPYEFRSIINKKKGFLKKVFTRRSTEIQIEKFIESIPYWFVNLYYNRELKGEYKELIDQAEELSDRGFFIGETGYLTYSKDKAFKAGPQWKKEGEYNEKGQEECWKEALGYFNNDLKDRIKGYFVYCFEHPEKDKYGIFKRNNQGKLIPKKSAEFIKNRIN